MNEKSMKRYAPVFLAPMLIAFTIGFIVPFVLGIYLSFCEFTTVVDAKWVGISNYIKNLGRRILYPLIVVYCFIYDCICIID